MTTKYRAHMLMGMLFTMVACTGLMAFVAEAALPTGGVRIVALAVFLGAGVIGFFGLGTFVAIELTEQRRFAERNHDVIAVDKSDHVFVRDEKYPGKFRELSRPEIPQVVMPAASPAPIPFAYAPDMRDRIVNGEATYDH